MTDTVTGTTTTSARKGLTLWPATALVTGTIIGAGIFTQPTWLAQYGPISLVGFAITAVGSLMLALVFSSLAGRSADVGGPYAFARHGFGDFIGFQAAWTYWIGAWVGVGAIATTMISYLGELVPAVRDSTALSSVIAIAAVAVLTSVNTGGVEAGGILQFVLTLLKVVPLLLIGTLGFIAFDADNLGPFCATDLPTIEVITAVMAYTLFSFIGVEAATIPAGDVHEPEKTIPRATIIGTLAAAAVYLLSTTAVFGAVPNAELQASDAAFALAAENMFGSWAGTAVSIVAVISCLGAMNGLILLSGQIPMAAEFDGLAPKAFGKINARHAPSTGLIVSGSLAAGLIYLSYQGGGIGEVIATLVIVTAVFTMVSYAFSAAAEVKWLLLDVGSKDTAHIARKMLVAILALAFTIFAFYGGGAELGAPSVYWLWIFMMFGVPLYVTILWRRQRQGLSVGGQIGAQAGPSE